MCVLLKTDFKKSFQEGAAVSQYELPKFSSLFCIYFFERLMTFNVDHILIRHFACKVVFHYFEKHSHITRYILGPTLASPPQKKKLF